jgi:hypothetical protein
LASTAKCGVKSIENPVYSRPAEGRSLSVKR